MFILTAKAEYNASQRRYFMPEWLGFEIPLRVPAAIFMVDVEIFTQHFNAQVLESENTRFLYRGNFYKAAQRFLGSRHSDMFIININDYPKIYHTLPVWIKPDSFVALAFSRTGEHRIWLYIENYEYIIGN